MRAFKISVVTPSFNQSRFLESTINSVLSQEYPNLEYVIIDGDSSDESKKIIKKNESQLKYWCSEPDLGHGNAINKGFQHCSGEIMAWINSDDLYTPWAFRAVNEVFQRFPEIDWIVGFNSWWNSQGVMLKAKREPKNVYDFLMGRFAWIQQESVFWRRSLWEKVGSHIDESYSLMIDGELWTRFFQHADLYTVDAVLAGYRNYTENRAIGHHDECVSQMNRAIQKMQTSIDPTTHSRAMSLKELNESLRQKTRWHEEAHRLRIQHFDEFKSINYKNIYWENEKWRTRDIPFLLGLDGYP